MTTNEFANLLENSRQSAEPRERLTVIKPDLSLDEAYKIQAEGIRIRNAEGEKKVGYKMGLTSRAKMEQMGLTTPIYGVLLDSMQVPAGQVFSLRGTIHPKIEPEIAFVLTGDLKGEVSLQQAQEACGIVAPALEILDSRFIGFKYFSLPDVVADNCSSSHFVLGEKRYAPKDMNLSDLFMTMKVNGETAQSALSNSVLGHPLHSVVELCRLLAKDGQGLKKGDVVLTGAATQAVALKPGIRIDLDVRELGNVFITVESEDHG